MHSPSLCCTALLKYSGHPPSWESGFQGHLKNRQSIPYDEYGGQCINQHILKMKYFEFLVETESRSVSFCDGRERLWGLRRVRWRRHINCQLSENRWREKSFPDKFQNYSRRHRLGIQHWPISVCFVFSQVLFSQFNRLPVICCKFRLVH